MIIFPGLAISLAVFAFNLLATLFATGSTRKSNLTAAHSAWSCEPLGCTAAAARDTLVWRLGKHLAHDLIIAVRKANLPGAPARNFQSGVCTQRSQ